ncbi:kinase-like domain-containing protein [Xylaria curta]|nr:kinase-like domain-containing protein [Xylaria curta]
MSTVQSQLTSAMIHADGPDNWFMPNDQLNQILNYDVVRNEITTLFNDEPPEQIEELVGRICGQEGDSGSGVCRKIFAVLVVIDQARSIEKFTVQDISDADLPLEPTEKEKFETTALRKRQESTPMLIEIEGWTNTNYRNFLVYQWRFDAPVFTKDTTCQDHIPTLADQTILPWIPDDKLKDKHFQTGHSEVRPIKIHPGHHDFNSVYSQSVFALKKLHKKEHQDVIPEIETLRKFCLKDETHLIQLLTTFYWKNECYLVFPWAEGGSLEDLWQNNSNSPLSKEAVTWISDQCYGVAKGLYQIHEYQLSDWSRAALCQPEGPHGSGDMEFGLHGDIKPANILWFRKPQDSIGAGVLKICDFGLAQFHSKETHMRSEHDEWIGCSPTYRPPEWDLEINSQDRRRKPYSRKTDIWGLGCVYLEFITWILLGSVGIEEFSAARSADDQPNTRGTLAYHEDVFFQIEVGKLQATVKGSVTEWIKKLHKHPQCSRYLHDFLVLIKDHMLVANQNDRAKCGFIRNELEKISRQCRNSDDYCFRPSSIDLDSDGPEPTISTAPTATLNEPNPLMSSPLTPRGQIHENEVHGDQIPRRPSIHEGSHEPIEQPSCSGQEGNWGIQSLSWLRMCCCLGK